MYKTSNRKILAFVHIEKAAGTTLIHLLRINFLLRHCDVSPMSRNSNKRFCAEDMKKILKINPMVQSIAGHAVHPCSNLESIIPNVRYITLLRDPIKRYVSQYQYWVEKLGYDISFQEFLDNDEPVNWQTKKIAGSEDVRLAKKLLDEKFFLVGIVEEFDEFLILLQRKLMPYKFRPGYRVQNVGEKQSAVRKQAEIAQRKHVDAIIKRNELDLEIYSYVKQKILPNQKVAYGKGFENDVSSFKNNIKGYFSESHRYIDYIYRKAFLRSIIGFYRKINQLTWYGSY